MLILEIEKRPREKQSAKPGTTWDCHNRSTKVWWGFFLSMKINNKLNEKFTVQKGLVCSSQMVFLQEVGISYFFSACQRN